MTDPIGAAAEPLAGVHIEFIADQVAAHDHGYERDGVPRTLLTELGRRGLFGDVREQHREIAEVLAGSSADTWFCWTQHTTPLRSVQEARGGAADELRDRWLNGLATGQSIAAVAVAHVRRPGKPNPNARRVPGGWVLNGTLDWVTSWDIADVLLLMVRHEENVLQFLVPIGNGGPEGLEAGPILDLVAMRGTYTRPIALHNVFLTDDVLLQRMPFHAWQQADMLKTSQTNPAFFGVVRSAVAELADIGVERDDPVIRTFVTVLTRECQELRRRAYAPDSGPETRAQALRLTLHASTAVVIARAGAAMRSGSCAERRMRAALFMQVQAQTLVGRDTALRSLTEEFASREE